MKEKVLITGGTGMVGGRLTKMLQQRGYTVSYLSRSKSDTDSIRKYQWDINKGYIEAGAIKDQDYIVHLAGAGVADSKWTPARKKIILDSRVKSTQLLFDTIQENDNSIKAFVSASAIGLYGFDTGKEIVEESSPIASDFLAEVVEKWESEVDRINSLGIRTLKMRIGIVLSNEGGALAEMSKPVRFGVGAALGSGDQYMSWIHIDDLCRMIIFGMENDEMLGAYNAVGPEPCSNRTLMKSIAKTLHKPFILPAVPAFVMKLMMGEMAMMVLGGINASSRKIEEAGFKFKYSKLKEALSELLD